MDIFTHAAVGFTIGAKLGHPVAGTVAGIVPDIALGIKRKCRPPRLYVVFHSYEVAIAMLAGGLYAGGLVLVVALAWCSHFLLDVYTHSGDWAPRWLFVKRPRQNRFEEWEFFNQSWRNGLLLAIALCGATLI